MNSYSNVHFLKTGQTVSVRTPVLGDEQALIDQMKIVDHESKFLAREDDEFNFTLEQERAFIQNCLNDENRFFLLAQTEDRIIANCSVGLISNNRRFRHRTSMGIAVCKEYWGKGIGTKLMQACIDWCKEKCNEVCRWYLRR